MEKSYEDYWQDIMENRRMNAEDEAYRLSHVLYGQLYNHNRYSEISGRTYDVMDAMAFWDSERPYGNKNVEASIAFHLGWDSERRLTGTTLPDFVREEARKLHDMVKQELIEQENFLQDTQKEMMR